MRRRTGSFHMHFPPSYPLLQLVRIFSCPREQMSICISKHLLKESLRESGWYQTRLSTDITQQDMWQPRFIRPKIGNICSLMHPSQRGFDQGKGKFAPRIACLLTEKVPYFQTYVLLSFVHLRIHPTSTHTSFC